MSIQMYRVAFKKLYRYESSLSGKEILGCIEQNRDAPTEHLDTWVLESMLDKENAK